MAAKTDGGAAAPAAKKRGRPPGKGPGGKAKYKMTKAELAEAGLRANGQPKVEASLLALRSLRQGDPPPDADAPDEAPRTRTGRRADVPALVSARPPEEDRLRAYAPYPRQSEFHAAGARHRERLFMAGNQLGKTTAGAAEVAAHATGLYPDWWTGRRFARPTVGWCAGITAETTRDTVQRLLLGRPRGANLGLVPDRLIEKVANVYTMAGATDTIMVRHVSGGLSVLAFKSYEKGRGKWQGETLDYLWFDEEPPADVYSEGLTRTTATGGLVFMTFTPLLGISEVVKRYLEEASPDRHVTRMTIEDAPHIAAEERERIVAGYPSHEREARAMGLPQLGSGRVFTVAEAEIACEPFKIPRHWPLLGALDFGWDHPTAAIKIAIDPEADCIYVTHTYRQAQETPMVHAGILREWGGGLYWAWPHDGLAHDKGSGVQLASIFRRNGLALTLQHATFEDGSMGVEAGVWDMLERMKTQRWKVFRHLSDWFEEFRLYHRRDGKLVKQNDDLLSASRYALMMKRWARPEGGGDWFTRKIVYPPMGIV